MFLTGLGTDYCIYYADHATNVWEKSNIQNQLAWSKTVNMPVGRLGFQFADYPYTSGKMSTYSKTKMNQVLDYWNAHGLKGILLLQNIWGTGNGYVGSQAFEDNWLQVAKDFKGDNRVGAFNLFGEAYYNNTSNRNIAPELDTNLKFFKRMIEVADKIHAIDSTRLIILPSHCCTQYYGWNDHAKYIADYVAAGVKERPYIFLDIDHPYFFENSWDYVYGPNTTPEQKVDYLYKNIWKLFIDEFGADKCHIGETFPWTGQKTLKASDGTGGKDPNPELQKRWTIAFVNKMQEIDLSFDLWVFHGSPNTTPIINAVEASQWNGSKIKPIPDVSTPTPEPEPPTPEPGDYATKAELKLLLTQVEEIASLVGVISTKVSDIEQQTAKLATKVAVLPEQIKKDTIKTIASTLGNS